MPARPWLRAPGGIFHVTARGVDRRWLFGDILDRRWLLSDLARAVARYSVVCHAYCLMTNHVHFVLETPLGNLPQAMHLVNLSYSRRFNKRYGRVGHLFEARYGAVVVEDDPQFLEECRYVVRNPVRGAICPHPVDWPWSSYAATSGMSPRPAFLTTERLLSLLAEDPGRARVRYVEFIADGAAMDERARARRDVT